MTQDFLDDLSVALQKEGRAFVLCIHHKGSPDWAHVRTEFNNWPTPPNGKSKEHDAAQAICAAMAIDGPRIHVLSEEQRQTAMGALDTLATLLATYGHTFTEGERAAYEQAVEALTG